MRSALEPLRLDELTVVHAGGDTYLLTSAVRAVAAARLVQDVTPLRAD